MKPLTIIAALLLLGGCAICEQHKTACTIGAVVIAGTAVAMAEAHHGTTLPPPPERIARTK